MSAPASKLTRPLIHCDRVQRLYPDGNVAALAEVTLSVEAGDFIAIVGPSGSGKSTLLNLLGGLDRPTAGVISFGGRALTTAAQFDEVRSTKIGFVFQSFNLLPTLTACENVQVPMFEGPLAAPARRAKAVRLLEGVGLAHRQNHLPGMLSAGERQRVAIARALANDPPLLLADEPTGNLDSVTGEQILELFDRLHDRGGVTLVVVTHSAEVAARAHRLIRIRDGRILEDRRQAPVHARAGSQP